MDHGVHTFVTNVNIQYFDDTHTIVRFSYYFSGLSPPSIIQAPSSTQQTNLQVILYTRTYILLLTLLQYTSDYAYKIQFPAVLANKYNYEQAIIISEEISIAKSSDAEGWQMEPSVARGHA